MTKPKHSFYNRLKKEPLIKFLIISVVIYVTYGFFGTRDAETLAKDNTITITSQEIDIMAFMWEQKFNRKPTKEELQKLIDTRVKETVLYEEAKKMGLDKDDVVIKRRVVLQYRNLVKGLLIPPDPNEEELTLYFQENIDAYIPEEMISVTQIFFDPDKREESTLEDAEKTLIELQNKKSLPDNYNTYGDNFMLSNVYTDITRLELQKYFGRGFTESVLELEPNVWTGPVLSGYGTHLVYVSKKQVPEPPLLEVVRETVLVDYLDDKQKELVKKYLDQVTAQYEVIIQEETNVN
jgi:peptidyl-prolyl cis-trans isomerase C